jgi:hypothetical protein
LCRNIKYDTKRFITFVPGERISPFNDDDLSTQELSLYGRPEAAGSTSGHQDLHLFGYEALVGFLSGLLVQNLPDLTILVRNLK